MDQQVQGATEPEKAVPVNGKTPDASMMDGRGGCCRSELQDAELNKNLLDFVVSALGLFVEIAT